jgi:hypothetical protein
MQPKKNTLMIQQNVILLSRNKGNVKIQSKISSAVGQYYASLGLKKPKELELI